MPRLPFGFVLAALLFVACTSVPDTPRERDYVLLVPDWKNHVVHRIGLDGTYEGDFLDPLREQNPSLNRTLWAQPLAILAVDGPPATFWLAADRALSEWNSQGAYLRTILDDTSQLEVPTCMVAIGDRVFVASADKRDMLMFTTDGVRRASFGHPNFYRANDCTVGPDGSIYVASTLRNAATPGVISIWDPADTSETAKPIGYRIPGDLGADGTHWAHSLVFDGDGKLLITEFARGRLERWDLDRNERVEVLLDSDRPGAYLKLARGPDGLVYMAGDDGVYRFDSRAKAADLANLKPFFDAGQLAGRYSEPYFPAGIAVVPRASLGAVR
jgi:sugar lactone lactonase YvrE